MRSKHAGACETPRDHPESSISIEFRSLVVPPRCVIINAFLADFAAKHLRIAPDLNEFHSDSSKRVSASIAQFGDVLGFAGPF